MKRTRKELQQEFLLLASKRQMESLAKRPRDVLSPIYRAWVANGHALYSWDAWCRSMKRALGLNLTN